jgi:ABC-type multidrug transport system fused ATPase/permease subunit
VHDFQQNVLEVAPKKEITPSTKKKIQLSFENISISAIPKKKRCGNKGPPAQPKVILNDVSGTILPGQFLAIIGASGMLVCYTYNFNRCWQDHITELPLW